MTLRDILKRIKHSVTHEEPNNLTEKRKTGNIGEDAALEYLEANGYRLRERNWRHSYYEIDLIVKEEGCLVFCEVKTRDVDKENYGSPAEAVTSKKQENLMKAASFYMGRYRETYRDDILPHCRFDIIEVYTKNNSVIKINHIKDAFIKRHGYKKKGTGYKSCRH